MTAMLIGGAVGPARDRAAVGPVRASLPVLVGVALHVVTSLLCVVAPAIVPLIALRTIQGFFNASATVVAMAIIRDRFVGSDASRLMSRLMLVIGVAPLFAPSIGGLIAGQWGWRAVFGALALFGVGAVGRRLAAAAGDAAARAASRRRAAHRDGGLPDACVRDRHFVALAILPGPRRRRAHEPTWSASPFVLREGYGLSSHQFALLFAVNGIGLVAGAQVNAVAGAPGGADPDRARRPARLGGAHARAARASRSPAGAG